ncbi:MAG: hypothetical protein ACO201_06265 [Rickettsiales bacterium]
MITDISNQYDQQLVTNQPDLKPIIEKLLEEADFKDVAQLIEDLSQKRHGDIESNDDRADYMISKESAGKLSNLFAKISKNIDVFFQDFSVDEFLPAFYQSMSDAQKRLGHHKLRPELRLELQPTAYSGFDDKFSQKDYQSLLFVLALLNYADEKSQEAVLDGDKFVDAHNAMQLQKSADELVLQRKPEFALTPKHARFFKNATIALNIGFVLAEIALLSKDIDKNINKERAVSNPNKSNQTYIKRPDYSSDDFRTIIMFPSILGGIYDATLNYVIGSRNNPNTNLLLLTTSLYLATHAIAETIVDKNIIKTSPAGNKPFFTDDQAFLYVLKFGLLFAGIFDRRYNIHNVADNMFDKFSSLACGVINFAKNIFHEKDIPTQPDKTIPSAEDEHKIDKFTQAFVKFINEGRVDRDGKNNQKPSPVVNHTFLKKGTVQIEI